MTPKRWLALLAFYISYLLFGASIYYHIENNLERQKRAEALQQRIEINEYLTYHLSTKDELTQNNILERITDYCDKPVTNYTLDKYEDPYRWTFYHSLFFAFTVCSTVGYGNLSPSTTLGQMIMIIYSLIGIPINGILFAGLGEFFTRTFTGIYHRYKKYKMSNDDKYVPRQFGLLATVLIALIPGITFFIIMPSLIFSYFEGWPYSLSLYFSYVTTTTIGFGDYVPTFQPHQEREFGIKFVFYQIFIIVWFIFSLGYLLMIMGFITKGLRSKKLAALEHQLSANIKATQSRIWHGVTKDVSYLRRILNELYIMKFKPVYNEPGEKNPIQLSRSASCPELTMYRVFTPVTGRKRAFSENFQGQDGKDQFALGTPLHGTMRVSSDTDLEKINKTKTFETAHAFMETTDLLARVVTALANIRPPQDDVLSMQSTGTRDGFLGGYQGFSDSQILASEGSWTYAAAENPVHYQRARASSDFYISPYTMPPPMMNNEWTWGGDNNQIQEVINKRVRGINNKRNDLYRASFQIPPLDKATIINMEGGDGRNDEKPERSGKSFLKRLIPFRKKSSASMSEENASSEFDKPPDNYSTFTMGDRLPYTSLIKDRLFSEIKKQDGAASSRRPSGFSLGGRRASAFVTGESSKGNMLSVPAQSNLGDGSRRRSMFATASDRRGSLLPRSTPRRDSLFSAYSRRGSLFSVPSQEEVDQEVLESTTIADLIRALEVMHTRDALEERKEAKQPKRKLGTASLSPPKLPPLFTLFGQNSEDQPPPTNYSRRPTLYSLSSQSPQQTVIQRRPSNTTQLEPPPYTEKESPKFKRRFSVRPTNLQIPPGKAPPTPKSQISQQSPQTALQRRLSLRPSPLAREAPQEPSTSSIPSVRSIFARQAPAQSSIGRGPTSTSSSSTHSPLSRIAQIQASRKSSMPETKQPDVGNQ